ASVGVARPVKMVPSTRKIRPADGMMPRRHFDHNAQPCSVRASSGSAGTSFGQSWLTMKTQMQNSTTWMMLGPIAPAYMSPTERPIWSARTTRTSDGGMSWVIVPDAAMTPIVWRVEYPYLSIGVIEITPIAMTEAATVPVMAPRTAPTKITAYERPPRTGPKS